MALRIREIPMGVLKTATAHQGLSLDPLLFVVKEGRPSQWLSNSSSRWELQFKANIAKCPKPKAEKRDPALVGDGGGWGLACTQQHAWLGPATGHQSELGLIPPHPALGLVCRSNWNQMLTMLEFFQSQARKSQSKKALPGIL